MTDDSLEIKETTDFHPCSTPRGCTYYNTQVLTECQQFRLNDFKLKIIKSDEKYLRMHPEIRGYIILILRHIYKLKPRNNIPGAIHAFFRSSHEKIEADLEEYLKNKNPVEEEIECEDETYGEDFEKYWTEMEQTEEETDYRRPYTPSRQITTDGYIRALLFNKMRQFPSGRDLLSQCEEETSAWGIDYSVSTEERESNAFVFDELLKELPDETTSVSSTQADETLDEETKTEIEDSTEEFGNPEKSSALL